MEESLQYEKNNSLQQAAQWVQQGREFIDKKQYKEALYAFEEALRLDSDNIKAYYGKGLALEEFERYNETIQAYDQVLRLNPDHASSYYGKGLALAALDRHKQAIQAYNQVLRLNPNYKNAYYCKGNALLRLEKYDEAIQAYDYALQFGVKKASKKKGGITISTISSSFSHRTSNIKRDNIRKSLSMEGKYSYLSGYSTNAD